MALTVATSPGSPALEGYVTSPRTMNIPTNLRQPKVMSDTSLAVECFVNQRFSAKLQAYLISYNGSVANEYSIYAI